MIATAMKELREKAENSELFKQTKVENIVILRRSPNFKNPCKYLFIGEAPGFEENKQGKPFVGKSGKLLNTWIQDQKIEDYVIINAVPIIPLNFENKIRKPSEKEIDYFRPYTRKLIKEINPQRIICLGKSALEFLELNLKPKTWTKRKVINKFFDVGFQYHPAYYLRKGNAGIEKSIEDFNELIMNGTDW